MQDTLQNSRLLKELYRRRLFWRHSGDVKKLHAILSSGKHATGLVNIREALTDPFLREDLAKELIRKMGSAVDLRKVTVVAGSGYASDFLVGDVARLLSLRFRRPVRSVFTDKVKQNGDEMEFKFDLKSDDVFLFVEDMQTSGHTTAASMRAIWARNPNVTILPVVGSVFTWNEYPEHLIGFQLVFLAESQMETYDPTKEECPLCKAGSEAIKPKAPGNWQRLTAG